MLGVVTGPSLDVSAVARRLATAGCVAAEREAAELLAAAPDPETIGPWVRRREAGEPLAWITGWTTFCGRRRRVDPGVYVPRPQTEVLARRAADLLPVGGRAVDLCTGSGVVAAHLRDADGSASVVGVDIDARAAACARRNGVPVVVGDLDRALHALAALDVVTAVAPYVPRVELALLPADVRAYEPRAAHDGGADGLALVRRVVVASGGLLRPGGRLLVELGGEQDDLLADDLDAAGFVETETWRDAEGDLRGLVARRR